MHRLESLVFQHNRPKFWAWYCNDNFAVIECDQVFTFKECLNSVFPDIQFTMKEEENSHLASLDVLFCHKDFGGLNTKVFRKATNTKQVFNYKSNHPISHKRSCVRTLYWSVETRYSEPEDKITLFERVSAPYPPHSRFSLPPHAKGEGKQTPQQKALPQTTSKPSDTPKVAKSHVLLFNFDSLNESLLAGFLKKRGVNAQTLGCIYSPVALLGLPNDEAAKKAVSACSGATYNTRALSAVMVDGDVSKILTNKSKQTSNDGPLMTVFASNLPKSLTTEDIKKIIGVEPKSMRLLTSGPKNRLFNACYIDCLSEADARKAFKALEGRSESGTNIRAFLKNQQQWPAVTETTLIITNAPFTIGVEQMKKEFPTATLVESTKKGSFHLTFKTKEDKEKAATKAKGKVMEGRPLRVVIPGEEKKPQKDSKPNSLVVSNLPFTAKIDEIRQLYPGCSWVTLKKRDDGKFNGTAVISFKSAEDAKKALNETPSKQVQGRQLRAHLESQQPEAPVKETPSKKEAKQTARILCETPGAGLYGSGSTCLNVFNVPDNLGEEELRPYFPSARSIRCRPYGACVLQFRSERDCQAVYDECQTGKDVGGQTVQAQFGEGRTSSTGYGQQQNEMHGQQEQKSRYGTDRHGSKDGCVLKVHNLSWSVTDEELLQEFPDAVSANVMMTDQGRSRG
ncbi:unnamed protein product [Dibothriocephalus latus]|uniref:RRM domain-containing protein n=1 Tax=Dibothriocephalus latus TaxID=60516 RepID=A0A3P7PD45_DIBLA|nr:unnamed protein product [Dibothriocephalus latus]